MKKEFTYYLYSPCGNDTALVENINIDDSIKRKVNDKIMKLHQNIEQVGFVSKEKNNFCLIMAGGEFCGNATRCAAYYYLEGKPGNIKISVSENLTLKSGIDEQNKVWSQMPIYNGNDVISVLDEGITIVRMKGIKYIVIDEKVSIDYLKDKENLKAFSMNFIKKSKIMDSKAIGVIYKEKIDNKLKIHPVIWVKAIDTLFYETACGSGTTAVAILEAITSNSSQKIDIIQPSNQIITADVIFDKGNILDAYIYGNIKTDGICRKITIDI